MASVNDPNRGNEQIPHARKVRKDAKEEETAEETKQNVETKTANDFMQNSFGERKKYTTHEYAEAFRYWTWQQQWIQQMNWMTWMYMNFASSMYYPPPNGMYPPGVSPVMTSPGSPVAQVQPTSRVQPQQHQAQTQPQMQQNMAGQQRRGRECTIPLIWKRVVAELIDFFFLFILKLAASLLVIEYMDITDIEKYDIENLFSQNWDPQLTAAFTSDLIAIELINRVCISIFEALCLRKGIAGNIGGTTPGKRMMCLYVVSCQEIVQLQGTRVLVIPATDIGFWNALVRSVVKNFSFIFFFPICLTAFFFPNSRTAYDIFSNSVVIEVTQQEILAMRLQRNN